MDAPDARARILEAALALFRERGFDETTMREIASRAKVATGLAYYYFDSKNAIVLAFYQRTRHDLAAILEPAHRERTLAARLSALIDAKFKYFAPNRRFLGALMGHAADPEHALSPFNPASEGVRGFDISQFERAIVETRTRVPPDLAPHLAKMLWFYQMGLLLFWIYDRSAGQRRTRQLLDASLSVVVTLVKLSNLPLVRPARARVLKIIEILEG
jgi:AcrR family transcriptional regulator